MKRRSGRSVEVIQGDVEPGEFLAVNEDAGTDQMAHRATALVESINLVPRNIIEVSVLLGAGQAFPSHEVGSTRILATIFAGGVERYTGTRRESGCSHQSDHPHDHRVP